MFGSLITRFRVAMLLLAFGLGLAGQLVSNVAMASQMQAPTQIGIGSGHMCPGCATDEQPGSMMAGCSVAACWTSPALPAQDTGPQLRPAASFSISPDRVIAGVTSAPDPHPPRPFLSM
jgi:hypothetical protein